MTTGIVRRVLVALDQSPVSLAALEEAAALAAGLQAELEGVYVLDAELLRLSALPLAWETGIVSGARRALDHEQMERSLRTQAEKARQALESVARRHRLRCSFVLSQGNVAVELTAAAARADVLAMGLIGHAGLAGGRVGSTTRRIRASARCALLLLGPGQRHGQTVVAVANGTPDVDSGLDLALEIARRRDAPLVVAIAADVSERGAVREKLQTRLADAGVPVRIEEIPMDGFDALRGLVVRQGGGLLVVGRDSRVLAGHDEDLDRLGCPVMLAHAPGSTGVPDAPV
jgi:nucleotide-binding universal stress UspA family protein